MSKADWLIPLIFKPFMFKQWLCKTFQILTNLMREENKTSLHIFSCFSKADTQSVERKSLLAQTNNNVLLFVCTNRLFQDLSAPKCTKIQHLYRMWNNYSWSINLSDSFIVIIIFTQRNQYKPEWLEIYNLTNDMYLILVRDKCKNKYKVT